MAFAAGDRNLYRYVGNGPLNGVDPEGLEFEFPSFAPPTTTYHTPPPRNPSLRGSSGTGALRYANEFAGRMPTSIGNAGLKLGNLDESKVDESKVTATKSGDAGEKGPAKVLGTNGTAGWDIRS